MLIQEREDPVPSPLCDEMKASKPPKETRYNCQERVCGMLLRTTSKDSTELPRKKLQVRNKERRTKAWRERKRSEDLLEELSDGR